MTPPAVRAAIFGGYSEYYIPGPEEQMWGVFADLAAREGAGLNSAPGMHTVISITATGDDTTVYYDHWEDGYEFDPDDPDNTYDLKHVLDAGEVWELVGENIPCNPRGTATFYDGGDRLYVAGTSVTVSRTSWPEDSGTTLSISFELFPIKPFLTNYTIPVGVDLATGPENYDDFSLTYVLVQSVEDNNTIQIDDPTTGYVDVTAILDRGEVTQLYAVNSGTHISATYPVQVHFIVGRDPGIYNAYEARGYNAMPDSVWDNEYYNPVGSQVIANTDLYLYNPHTTSIIVEYADTTGSGSFTIPAKSTISYQDGAGRYVPVDSGVYLRSDNVFWGVGSYDTESRTYEWGYSLVPKEFLTDEYFLSWAPGTSETTPTSNGSPAFVTAVFDDTVVFVDYSPTDGIINWQGTLNRLESQKVFDPDNVNTGMHIWATAPLAVVWGQDAATAGTGTPYLDLGTANLPITEDWIDLTLGIEKTADPSVLPPVSGSETTFTLVVNTYETFPVSGISAKDILPDGFSFKNNSARITFPDTTQKIGSSANPTITGQEIKWNNTVLDGLDMAAGETLTITFEAVINGTVTNGTYSNTAQASGIRLEGSQVFSPFDTAAVYVTALTIDKDTSTPSLSAGDTATYAIRLDNISNSDATNVTITDTLAGVGFSYDAADAAITLYDSTDAVISSTTDSNDGSWNIPWTIGADRYVVIVFDVDIAGDAVPRTYDSDAQAEYDWGGSIDETVDDKGEVEQDSGTPHGEDPEDDEDVTVNSLVINKTTSTATVQAGGTATYSIRVQNDGNSALTGVTVTDDLPAGFNYDGITGTTYTEFSASREGGWSAPSDTDTSLSWGAWTLGAGGYVIMDFVVNVPPAVPPGTYDNSAMAFSNETGLIDDAGAVGHWLNDDPGTHTITDAHTPDTDTEADEDVTVQTAVLQIDMDSIIKYAVANGLSDGTAQYQIKVLNAGTTDATNVQVSSTLPANFSNDAGSDATITLYDADDLAISSATDTNDGTWTIPWDIGPGQYVILVFDVIVDRNTPAGTYDSDADATSTETAAIDDDGTVGYDSDTITVEDPEDDEDVQVFGSTTADLAVDKYHSGDFDPASTNTFSIDVTNSGPSVQTSTITITDDLPTGLNYDSYIGTGWSCSFSDPTVTCTNNDDIPVGGSLSPLSINVTIDTATATSSVDNTATVSSPTTDHIPENDSDTDTTVILMPDLSSSEKTVLDANGGDTEPNDLLRYTIRITESAGIEATGVSVTDDIPLDVSGFVASSVVLKDSTGTPIPFNNPPTNNSTDTGGANGTGYLEISNVTVPANDYVEIVFEVNVAAGTPQGTAISNTADIDNPDGPNETVDAQTLIVQASQIPAEGEKALYLYGDQSLSRTPPDPPQSYVEVLENNTETWTLTPVSAGQIDLDATNGIIPVTLNVRNDDTSTNRHDMTVTLAYSGTSTGTIGSVDINNHNLNDTIETLIFNVPISGNITLDAGTAITMSFWGDDDSGNDAIWVYPIATVGGQQVWSKVALDVDTAINVDTVAFYDAAYPAGTLVTTAIPGSTLYARGDVSDPFGSYDITDARIDIVDSEGSLFTDNAVMSEVYDSVADDKIYEYEFTVPASGPVDNWTATVTASEGMEGDITHSGVGVITINTVTGADLAISKYHTDTFYKNTNAHFIIDVTNHGPEDQVADVVVTDTVPAGLTYVSSSGSGWILDTSGLPTVTWTYPAGVGSPVPAGTNLPSITLTVHVDSSAASSIQNTATVDPGVGETNPENNTGNNTSTDTVYVVTRDVVKSVDMGSPYYEGDSANDELTYTITVTNTGSGAMQNIEVTDSVPTGTTYVAGSSTVTAPAPIFRVTEYYVASGFTGTSYNLTLDQDLATNYFVIVQGSDGDGATRGPDENYVSLTGDPFGTGDLNASGASDVLQFTRHNNMNGWKGVITVVESLRDLSGSGFVLRDVARVTHSGTNTSGSDTFTIGWSDINQVMLIGGFNGSGCDMSNTSSANHNSCHVRIWPSGTDQINWSRNAGGTTLQTAFSTVMAVEWGSDWTVQRVRVNGNSGANGATTAAAYTTAGITGVARDNTWVWGVGHTNDNGIGDAGEGVLITLGDGISQNPTENEVAIGIEYAQNMDFEVYALTHANLAVDYRFKPDGDSGSTTYNQTVDAATGNRLALITNGSNGTSTFYPRPIWWARYTANDTVQLERRYSGENWPAWVQGIDFSGTSTTTNQSGGDPPNLVTASDGYSLQPGESMTITYNVTIDDAANPGDITNTVSVTSDQSSQPSVASVVTEVRTIGVPEFTDDTGAIIATFDYADNAEPIYVRVYDPDRNTNPNAIETVIVTVTNPDNGDSMTITLYETGVDTGMFAHDGTGALYEIPLISCDPPSYDCYPEGEPLPSAADTLYVEPGTSPQLELDYADPADAATDTDQATAVVLTRVALSEFRAYEENGATVVLWETASEIGTIGFYLLRLDAATGKYRQIHETMLPGLLLASRGGVYRFVDSNALFGKTYTYQLIEVESRGTRNLYGPYTVTVGAKGADDTLPPVASDYDKTPHHPALLASDPSDTVSRPLPSTSVKTSMFARALSVISDPPINIKTLQAEPGDRIRISVTQTGLFYLSASQIASLLGIEESEAETRINQGTFSLSNQGRQVAYYPVTGPATGNPGITFYGTGIDSIYTDENVYWLTQGNGIKVGTIGPADPIDKGDIDGDADTDLTDALIGLQVLSSNDQAHVRSDYVLSDTDVNGNGRIDLSEVIYILQDKAGLRAEPGIVPVSTAQHFMQSLHVEEETVDGIDYYDDPEGDFWFWDYLFPSVTWGPNPDVRTFALPTDGLADSSAIATLKVELFGGSSASHQVEVYINDHPIGQAAWQGNVAETASLSFESSFLIDGENTVTLEGYDVSGTGESFVYIEGFDITYPRTYRTSDNQLLVRGQGNEVVTVEGFENSDILVFDVTAPLWPRLLSDVIIDYGNGSYRATFEPAGSASEYLAVIPDTSNSPYAVEAGGSSTLKQASNRADYLIIAPSALETTAQALADYRQARGLETMLATLDDIMVAFSHGIYRPDAIKDFLEYAYRNWAQAPRYIVLVGKGTFDFKDVCGYGNNLLPPLLIRTSEGIFASDNGYADVEGDDGIPEMAIGRLAASNEAELQTLIDKIMAYERTDDENWKQRVIMIADDPDSAGDFDADSDRVASGLSADPHVSVNKIYLSEHTPATAHQMVIDGISDGALVVNYIGHGGYDSLGDRWPAGPLLGIEDIPSLDNGNRLAVVTALTCITGRYTFPDFDSLGEEMMALADGGAIAVWSPTGLSVNSKAAILDEEFMNAVFSDGVELLGDAVLEALESYGKRTGDKTMPGIYNLLGDPALRLQTIYTHATY
jgi:uncharacterized repeat protein (TIGR01451 family)/fimbrial isopeptide formation D2 family protein